LDRVISIYPLPEPGVAAHEEHLARAPHLITLCGSNLLVVLCACIILSAIFAPRCALQRALEFRRASLGWACVGGLLLGCEQIAGIKAHQFSEPPVSAGGMTNDSQWNEGGSDAGVGALGSAGKLDGSQGGNANGAAGDEPGGAAGASAGLGPNATDEAPSIEWVEPAPGARGVGDLTEIVIAFSTPMDIASVESAYLQKSGDPGALRWNAEHTKLTVSAGLKPVRSSWVNADRPGQDSELAVSYEIGGRARDKAGMPMGKPFSATFYLQRHVEHRISLCLDLSGSASAASFEAAAAQNPSVPCVTASDAASAALVAGDREGKEVVAIMSYSLGFLPLDVRVQSADVRFAFDKPVGNPHQLYGTLELQEARFGLELARAFDASAELIGVLAFENVIYPHSASKDVAQTVIDQLASRTTASTPLAQFRAKFSQPIVDANGTPDYARLAAAGDSPKLTVTYTCAVCP
jgi:hypothetical protein